MEKDASMKNTKKELLEIIEKMQQKMAEKENVELNPEKLKKEIQTKETLAVAEEITKSDLTTQIHGLKMAVNRELSELSEKIEAEAKKYTAIQESIQLKQAELEEIYGIEKHTASLAAILESQHQITMKFDAEMNEQKEHLRKEIADTKAAWKAEQEKYNKTLEEEKKNSLKERQREDEEYLYNQQRTRAIEENNFTDKLAALEKEFEEKKEKIEKHVKEKTTFLDEREQKIIEREKEFSQLEQSVKDFPDKLDAAVIEAVKRKEKELTSLFSQEKALIIKEKEGEKNVFQSKLSALESLVKDQAKQIDKLNSQQEKAYQQVQEIASKAVAGAAERPQTIAVKTVERNGNN